jgi:hypothetical protein
LPLSSFHHQFLKSSFVALVHYLVSNDVPAVLSQTGHELVVHTVITGAQALLDTLHGVAQLVKQLDSVRSILWLNPFWGPIAEDGKTFEQMKTYQDIKKRIETVVNLLAFGDELFPQDIAAMLKGRAAGLLFATGHLRGMTPAAEKFRQQIQKELGLTVGPKDPLLALWVAQQEFLEETAAEHQKLLSEFEAALGRNQTLWTDQAKGLANQSLNAALRAARDSSAALVEEAARN